MSDKYLDFLNAPEEDRYTSFLRSDIQRKEEVPTEQKKGILEKFVNEPIAGVGEAALSMTSGLGASALGGLQGLATLISGGGVEEAVKQIGETQRGLTYQPSTEPGKALVHIAGIPIEFASNVMGAIGGKIGGNLGQTIGEASVPIVATLLGGMGPLKSVATTKFTPPTMPKQVPIVTPAMESVRDVLRARTPEGIQKLAEEYIQKTTPAGEIPSVLSALEKRGQSVVPGSPVTSAEAIARANRQAELMGKPERFGGSLVALQEGLSSVPETSSALNTIKLQQEAARANILKKGAGTEQQYAAAEAIREGAAKATYPSYGKKLIEGNQELSSLMETPVMETAIGIAEKIAANDGVPFKIGKDVPSFEIPSVSGAPNMVIPAQFAQYPLSNLQHIKMALDRMIQKPQDFGIAATERGAMVGVRNKLVNWIEKKSPEYEAANMQYAIDSVPLNQMDLWRLFQNKLITPTGKEAPGSYLSLFRNELKAVKDATGLTGKSNISDILDTKQSALAARLAAEMEMELVKKRMAGEVSLPGVGKAGENLEPHLPNLLWRPSMFANFLLRHLAKDANVDINIAASKILSDPKMLSNVLKQVKPNARTEVLTTIKESASIKNKIPLASMGATVQGSENETQ